MRENSTGTRDGSEIVMAFRPIIGWKNASIEWGESWEAFVGCNITVNAALVLWAIINIILIFKGKTVHCRQYFLSLNFLVLLYAITRLLYYAIDPKSINKIMPLLAGNLLSNACFPILTVGFFLLYVALKQCTIPNEHLLPLILKPKSIIIFTLACFVLSFATDVVVAYSTSMQVMIMVCQCFYIVWGVVFFCLYSVLVIRFKAAVRRSKRKMASTCYKRGHCRRDFSSRNLLAIPACMKIAYVSALLFLAMAFFNGYLVLAEIGLIKTSLLTKMCDTYRKLWPFFAFHVAFTSAETAMALTLVIAGTQPLKRLQLKKLQPINSIITTSTQHEMTTSSFNVTASSSVFTIESSGTIDTEGISNLPETTAQSNPAFSVTEHSASKQQNMGLAYIQEKIYSKFPP